MPNALIQKRLTYATLSGIFVLAVGSFALLHSTATITPLLIAELGFAVYRLGRMVSYDTVMETYRLPFVETIPDPTGAGDTTEARGEGWREAIGNLVCCPICVGTWIAALLVVGLNVLPGVTNVFITIFCVVGIAELLNGATEFLQWNGQMAREYAGSSAMAKKEAREDEQELIPTAVVRTFPRTHNGNHKPAGDGAAQGDGRVTAPAPVPARSFRSGR